MLNTLKSLSINGIVLKQLFINGVLSWQEPVTYKNWVKYSTESDGVTIYNNGKGYKDGYRIRSGGAEVDMQQATCTGYIKVVDGDIIRWSGIDFSQKNTANALNVYDANFTNLGQICSNEGYYGIFETDTSLTKYRWDSIVEEPNEVYRWIIPSNKGISYIRLTGATSPSGVQANGSKFIVTINEEIVESAKKIYSISNLLTNCTSSNNIITVEEGASYKATITANDGYTLENATVTVIMNGVNITSSVYKNGIITIASVTGNVTITAVALEEATGYTNLVPLSTESDGKTIYNNGKGYKDGYRVRSGGAEGTTGNGTCTGFISYVKGDKLYIYPPFDGTNSENAINFYDSSFTCLGQVTDASSYYGFCTAAFKTKLVNGISVLDISSVTVSGIEKVAYVRVTNKIGATISSGSEMIITKNQEII